MTYPDMSPQHGELKEHQRGLLQRYIAQAKVPVYHSPMVNAFFQQVKTGSEQYGQLLDWMDFAAHQQPVTGVGSLFNHIEDTEIGVYHCMEPRLKVRSDVKRSMVKAEQQYVLVPIDRDTACDIAEELYAENVRSWGYDPEELKYVNSAFCLAVHYPPHAIFHAVHNTDTGDVEGVWVACQSAQWYTLQSLFYFWRRTPLNTELRLGYWLNYAMMDYIDGSRDYNRLVMGLKALGANPDVCNTSFTVKTYSKPTTLLTEINENSNRPATD